jgi:GNAT superfamily N-acetyltransferase
MAYYNRTTVRDETGRAFDVDMGTESDLEALLKMYDAFHADSKAQGLPPSEPEVRSRWVRLCLETGVNLLAWLAGEVVGHACLFPDMERKDAEYLIFVRHPFQHLGIGKRLTELSLEMARQLDLRTIWLTVESFNFKAIRLYKRYGFVSSDEGGTERTMILRL